MKIDNEFIGTIILIPFAIGLGFLLASLPIALALWILGVKL